MSKLDSKTGWKTDLPPFVDWRRAAAVTEVKEQVLSIVVCNKITVSNSTLCVFML